MKEIALIGFVQALFFATIVFLKSHKEKKDYLLSVFFVFLSFELLYRYLLESNSLDQAAWFVLLDIVYWALFGPLLILYINSLINKKYKFSSWELLHISPLLISLFAISKYFSNSSDYASFYEYFAVVGGVHKAALWVWEFASSVYLVWAIIKILKHKKLVKNYFSDLSRKELNWLLFLTIGFAIYMYASYLSWVLKSFSDFSFSFKFVDVLGVILTVYVFVLGVFGYKQEGVFFDKSILNINTGLNSLTEKKYLKTRLNEDELKNLVQCLNKIMDMEKPYLDCDLTIHDLAKKLDTSLHKLSQTINLLYKKNFFEYINSYRVNEFKEMLKVPTNDNLKIESLAYDCGFSSKSAFYAIFKRYTNITPTQYKNKLTKLN